MPRRNGATSTAPSREREARKPTRETFPCWASDAQGRSTPAPSAKSSLLRISIRPPLLGLWPRLFGFDMRLFHDLAPGVVLALDVAAELLGRHGERLDAGLVQRRDHLRIGEG